MKYSTAVLSVVVLALVGCSGGGGGGGDDDGSNDAGHPDADPNRPDAPPRDGRVFDHTYTDLSTITPACLDAIKASSAIFHYAHRSHGYQIIVGAESLEQTTPAYGFNARYCGAPTESGVLKMWDGMTSSNLIDMDQYWATTAGINDVRSLLAAQPALGFSMWAWSFEIQDATEQQVAQYLDVMDMLEGEFPAVKFVYMTGPAGSYLPSNRYARNEQIRAFARTNKKLLYDFEDLDAWYNGQQHTVGGIPMEHPRYSLDTSGNTEYMYTHTTQESSENKARAFWGMMAQMTCN
jgi:hypothetical protein